MKTLEASAVSGALISPFLIDINLLLSFCFVCVTDVGFWPFVGDRTVIKNSETENGSKDRLVSVHFRCFYCTTCCIC